MKFVFSKSYAQPTCVNNFPVEDARLMRAARKQTPSYLFDLGYESPYFVELGAGKASSQLLDRVCIDIERDDDIDLIYDLNYGIPLPDASVHTIHSNQLLEHIHNIIFLMNECWRVLVPGGAMWHAVPYYKGPHSWSDPTHVRTFTELSFRYFCVGNDGTPFVENFADYGIRCAFVLEDQKMTGTDHGLEVTLRKPG